MPDAPANLNTDRPTTDESYQPVSGFAVAALAVAVILVVIVVFLGGNSFRKGKPLLNSWLLGLAALGFFLSIVARFQIRRSEGTRSGMKLANSAWWITILVGAGYGAFLVATKFAVERQSRDYATEWFAKLRNLKDANPSEQESNFYKAFWATLDPKLRSAIDPQDGTTLQNDFTVQLSGFRSSRMVKLFQRNGKEVEIVGQSMGNWEQTPDGYQVDQLCQLRSPEGVFDVVLHMTAAEGKDYEGRQWKIGPAEPTPRSITSYGLATGALELESRRFMDNWLAYWTGNQPENTYLLTQPPSERPIAEMVIAEEVPNALYLRPSLFLIGGLGNHFPPVVTVPDSPQTDEQKKKAELLTTFQNTGWLGGGAVIAAMDDHLVFAVLQSRPFFKLKFDRNQGSPLLFAEIWRLGAVRRAEEAGVKHPELSPTIYITDNDVQLITPVYLYLFNSSREGALATVTVRCTDADLLKELRRLHDEAIANPGQQGSMDILSQLPQRHWQIVSIESALTPIKVERPPPPPKKKGR